MSDSDQKKMRHVAIIMDGNGRWAKSRNLSRGQGHIEGVKRVDEMIDYAPKLGVNAITLFTFSTENWARPESEVSMLMNILIAVLHKKLKKLMKNNIRFQKIGRDDRVPEALLEALNHVAETTKNNTGLIMNLAFNYGGRLEIVDAIRKIAENVKEGILAVDDITEETVSKNLYTHDLPDPDLLIRTSGEKRISNFLLWQLSYAEFYFTDKMWPEFTKEEFEKAIEAFEQRERRFGQVLEGTLNGE